MSHKPKANNGMRETVLTRQAAPKYNFTARKLPKQTSTYQTQKLTTSKPDLQQTGNKSTAFTSNSHLLKSNEATKSKPVAVIGASLQTPLASDTKHDKIDSDALENSQASHGTCISSQNFHEQDIITSSRNRDFVSSHIENSIIDGVTFNQPEISRLESPLSPKMPSDNFPNQWKQQLTNVCPVGQMTDSLSSFSQLHGSLGLSSEVCVKEMERERDKLKKDLEIQLQVNAELKRLLVASLGEDLCARVEKLCIDRAQLSLDVGGFSKKISEEYENLDKISIQADMWRSKYLASRVMIEELANSKAYYTLQTHDLQDALQQMLSERQELRENLLDLYRILQLMKTAFDPLNSQNSLALRSTNVLDLSRSCQQIAEAMRYRLLPASVPYGVVAEDDVCGSSSSSSWVGSVTRAEQFAHELLSRHVEPVGTLQLKSPSLPHLKALPDSPITRFHPHTRYENLTYACCNKCQGEINVI